MSNQALARFLVALRLLGMTQGTSFSTSGYRTASGTKATGAASEGPKAASVAWSEGPDAATGAASEAWSEGPDAATGAASEAGCEGRSFPARRPPNSLDV